MQRRLLMFLLAGLAAAAIVGCSKDSAATEPAALQSLTVDEVAARITAKDGKTFVFDNNPKDSWVKAHVPSATWLDEDSVTAAVMPADKAATLIFYCHNET
jgi:hypothetical protein